MDNALAIGGYSLAFQLLSGGVIINIVRLFRFDGQELGALRLHVADHEVFVIACQLDLFAQPIHTLMDEVLGEVTAVLEGVDSFPSFFVQRIPAFGVAIYGPK